ncbi:NB-ARC domain-containing protein [Streptomyces lincolnensis]|uniref:NB-ARC domain-containing protein n=1 Tax=Streptomyces lincolnensis TaxID=1915 RepID=A0A1B1M4W9_STRLN|nr:FxSxx-COOH system tetratricopeptide repeat protein [Streptomyces lincolnensis]ANS63696.1 NB-ARC domain-containing protein [Streptomyces lincolnensis]AXG52618.1 NB-ARC domain-containing protein [Streptomyces lincolnensis]
MTSFGGRGDTLLHHGPGAPWADSGRWTDITDAQGTLRALHPLRTAPGGGAFDMVVAVDTDPGMVVWQDTAAEFTGLLRRSRVFRRVDRCGLGMPPPGQVHGRRPPGRDPLPKTPGPARRLVLVLTDGTAPAWRSGAPGHLLHHWGWDSFLAIVHLLPFHAWPDAGIPTWPMSLRAARPGTPNRGLGMRPHGLGLDAPSAPPGYDGELLVPVLELTPRSLASWARLVTAGPSARVRVPLTYAAYADRLAPPPARRDAADAVARFRGSVSPDVFGLAVLLAAAPLAVPVVRRVMTRLRPGTRISDFAQLRAHQLIRPVTGPRAAPGRPQVSYDFEPGVRGELLAAGRNDELRQVVDVVSETLGPAARGLWRFPALLTGVEVPPAGPRNEETRLWLETETAVLHALSGPYATRARTLEEEVGHCATPPAPHRTPARTTGAAPPLPRGPHQEDPLNQPTNAPEPRTGPAQTAPGRLPGPAAHPMGGPSNRRTPAVWGNVPPRNPNFTGRGDLLDALHRRLRKEKTTAVLPNALHGMGGVGKSQLAIEYLYRHLAEYDIIWWISAERTTQVALSLVELAQRLGLEASTEATWSVSEVLEALRRGEPYANWLLVFDNADSPEVVRPYFPSGGPGNILITSRNPQWASAAQPLEVDVFRREESVQLLRVRGPEISDEEADRLAQALGDLPLAIEQAAAWRAETGMPADEYLRLLDEKMVDLLGLVAPLDYQLPVIAAWNVSLDQLETKNPAAMQLLQVCAFCAPEPISRTLFAGRPAHPIAPELDAVLHDPIRLGQAIREIGRYSLARFDHRTNSIQMHRLVQAALISRMTEAEQRRMRQGTHLLLAANDPTDPHNVINWPRYGELHAHLIVSEAVESTDRWVRSLIVNEVRYLCRWGNYDTALQLARSAYDSWRRESGEDDAQLLEVSRWLGFVLFNMGRYQEAADVNDRVLDAYRRTVGEDHEDTLDALGNVAIDRRVRGDFVAALELSESILQRYLRVLGPDDPETLRAAHNVAVSLRLTGDFGRAKVLDEETLHSKTQIFGQDHVVSLVTWLGLILDIRELGDYLTALSFQLELTEQSTRLLGHDNPFTLSNHRHLAVALRKAGRHEEARETAERSRADLVRRYGENNPGAMQSTLELTIDLRHAGELEQARDLGRRIHAQYTATYGALHPHTLSAEVDLAITLRQLGAADQARTIDERVLTELRSALGERHPSVLISATNLASDLYALGEYEAARQLDAETLALSTEVMGQEHPSTLACAANLPLDLKALGRTEEADLLHAVTAERLTRVLGADHPAVRQAVDWEHRADCDIDPLPL